MNQGLEDVGGPLRGIVLRMQVVQGQTHDRAEDTVLHSEQFRGLVERRAYTLKRINAAVSRYLAPLLCRVSVTDGDAAQIGDLVVTFLFRRRPRQVQRQGV